MSQPIVASKKSSYNLWMAIFAALSVIGVICWVIQLTVGLQVTNLSVTNMWGLYITFFMIFTGVAAGCLFFAAIPYFTSYLADFKPYCKIATYVGAVSSIVAASLFIMVDVGNPERAWRFITSGNFSSPMYWDFLMLAAYMVISVIFTRQLLLVSAGKTEEKSVKPIAIIAFVAGIMVLVTSFVFTIQLSRPTWNSPAQSISFLVSAFAAGLAVLMIVGFILNKSGYIKAPQYLFTKMGKTAAALLAVELILVILEVILGLFPGEGGGEYGAIMWTVAGAGAPLFWGKVIALVAGIVLLVKMGSSSKGSLAGAIVSLVAILLVKMGMLQTELFNPVLDFAGPAMYGNNVGPYFPSLIEIGLSVGIMSIGALLFGIGLKVLNLRVSATEKTNVQKAS